MITYNYKSISIGIANAKCKENLAFSSPKILSIWDCKNQVLQIFLQYCFSVIVKIELHCSNILKKKKIKCFSPKFLSPLFHYFCSLLSLPSLFLICSLLSSNPNTILLPTSTSHITMVHFFW